MHVPRSLGFGATLVVVLAACGGGGSSNPGPGRSDDQSGRRWRCRHLGAPGHDRSGRRWRGRRLRRRWHRDRQVRGHRERPALGRAALLRLWQPLQRACRRGPQLHEGRQFDRQHRHDRGSGRRATISAINEQAALTWAGCETFELNVNGENATGRFDCSQGFGTNVADGSVISGTGSRERSRRTPSGTASSAERRDPPLPQVGPGSDPGQLDGQERVQEQAEDQQRAGAARVDERLAHEPQRPADVAVRRRPRAAACANTLSTWTSLGMPSTTSATHGPIQPTAAATSTIG